MTTRHPRRNPARDGTPPAPVVPATTEEERLQPGESAERLAYSVDEAARLTGLSRDLLYDQMRFGNLDFIKVGRRRLITRQHLEQFLGIALGALVRPDEGLRTLRRLSSFRFPEAVPFGLRVRQAGTPGTDTRIPHCCLIPCAVPRLWPSAAQVGRRLRDPGSEGEGQAGADPRRGELKGGEIVENRTSYTRQTPTHPVGHGLHGNTDDCSSSWAQACPVSAA